MKSILLSTFIVFVLSSCTHDHNKTITHLENKIKVLQEKLDDVHKPGFGELMGNIQYHHLKLWFAGKNKNWELAKFEIHEIEENLEDIEKYQGDRKESESLSMINPQLKSLDEAIDEKNWTKFESDYKSLTKACNTCHKKTQYEFIKIKVPDFQPNLNQIF